MISKLIRQSLKPIKRATQEKAYKTWLKLFDELKDENIKLPVQVKAMNIRFNVHHVGTFLNQFESIFIDEIYRFKTKNNIPVIIDCGSNMGTSVLYFKQLYPQAYIYAFEPDVAIFSILQSNIALNNLSKVEAINKAVYIDNQERYFLSSNAQSGSIVNNDSSAKVSCIRLKDFLSSFAHIDFLKLDIEGAEVEVLNDIKELLFKVNHVFVEYHSYLNQPQSLSTLLSIFESNGFRYVIGGDQKKHPFTNEATDEKMDFTVDIFATKI